ncbi:MAG: ATP-binding cassette domain-containing protein, partial [candidate division Zixibacteria bacterium]|nr:ATP-binding cassette domain-containing protein [candidate division Zixibacteria bacterium]
RRQSRSGSSPVILAENVSYRYERAASDRPGAVDGVSLSVREGEFVALLGPNGSGKSTLGRLINGLLQVSAGRMTVDGLAPSAPDQAWEVFRRVGMVFQQPDNQLVSTSVERELAFGLENLGLETAAIRDRVEWGLTYFRLTDWRLYPPHRLSGGQKQRVAIACAVLMQSRYLVCDEPTSLLDPAGRREVLTLLHSLCREHNMGVVYITQTPEEATQADRVAVMRSGRIFFEGTPEETLTQTALLRESGLEPPPTVRLADALRIRGLPVPDHILAPEKLVLHIGAWKPGGVAPPELEAALSLPVLPHIVEFTAVTHIYRQEGLGAVPALNGVDLRIQAGECIGLIGPNGSGKSTLVQHLNRLLTPDTGSVRFDGKDLAYHKTDLAFIRRQVGLVFQFPETQLFEETVYDDVAFGPRNMGFDEEEVRRRVAEALERVHLDLQRYGERYPLALSGGEMRRVAIAGVLAMRPRLLALDEPTAGLDAAGARTVEAILRTFNTEGGTVLLISHDMDLVARLVRRVIVLDAGRPTVDALPGQVFADAGRVAAMGLELPFFPRLLIHLRDVGFPVRIDRYDVEETAEEILRSMSRESSSSIFPATL